MPNSVWSPKVTPNTPPLPGTFPSTRGSASATSSPHTRMRGSRAISSWSVRRIASPNATGSPAATGGSGGTSVTGGGPTRWCEMVSGSGRAAVSASLAATATSSFASARTSCARSGVSTPSRSSWRSRSRIGSCSASSSSSSATRYFFWSSESECEYGRVTVAWMSPGPCPARTRWIASAPRVRTSK